MPKAAAQTTNPLALEVGVFYERPDGEVAKISGAIGTSYSYRAGVEGGVVSIDEVAGWKRIGNYGDLCAWREKKAANGPAASMTDERFEEIGREVTGLYYRALIPLIGFAGQRVAGHLKNGLGLGYLNDIVAPRDLEGLRARLGEVLDRTDGRISGPRMDDVMFERVRGSIARFTLEQLRAMQRVAPDYQYQFSTKSDMVTHSLLRNVLRLGEMDALIKRLEPLVSVSAERAVRANAAKDFVHGVEASRRTPSPGA